MQGASNSKDQHGIIPRSFEHLFGALQKIRADQPRETIMVRISYAEVYNEKILDLLTDGDAASSSSSSSSGSKAKASKKSKGGGTIGASLGLQVREDTEHGRFYVKGLTDLVVENAAQMASLVDKGQERRTVTNMNHLRAEARGGAAGCGMRAAIIQHGGVEKRRV